MTTQSHLHPQRSENMPPVDRKGAAAPEQKPGEIPPDALTRASGPVALAAVSGARSEPAGSSDGTASEGPSSPASLDAADADRYALAFRPSWAPLHESQESHESKASHRVQRPAHAEPTPRRVALTQEEPLTVPGLGRRRRAATWASLLVVSFLALAYWGVSSATKTPHLTAFSPATSAPPAKSPAPEDKVPALEPRQASDPDLAERAASLSATNPGASNVEQPVDAPRSELAVAPTPATPATSATPPAPALAVAEPPPAPALAVAEPPPAPALAAAKPAPEPEAPSTATAGPRAARSSPPTTPNSVVAASAKHAATPAAPAEPARHPIAPPPTAAATAAPRSEHAAAAASPDPGPLHSRSPLLVVHGVPDGVRLWLDGQRMANPFDIRLPRGIKHRIEARADGFEPSTQLVRLDSDAKLTIALKRTPPPVKFRSVASPSVVRDVRPKAVDTHRRGAGFVTVSPY